jgi:hypothetical protein
MKNFNETFRLIDNRIRNLKGLIKTLQYCIENSIGNVNQQKTEMENFKLEITNLEKQDKQLRNYIVNEKYQK